MTHIFSLNSDSQFEPSIFFEWLSDCDIRLSYSCETDNVWSYYFVRENFSHTFFVLEFSKGVCQLYIDPFASMEDHRIFPYIVDTLSNYLGIELPEAQSPFKIYDEDWIEEHIAEGVAYLKCALCVSPFYYIETYTEGVVAISVEYLSKFGISIHSSTPRIYGYISYLMRNKKLEVINQESLESFYQSDSNSGETELEVDVPQHISIAKVKSWQIDGTETYDSFSKEDVELLLNLAESYERGEYVEPVVLNDIGTIFQEGVGVEQDGEKAVYWYCQAISRGERYYSPVNLGDIYRKGCGTVQISLSRAVDAFLLSDDPYAYYRIGQAYEEGWLGAVNNELAMHWYQKSAKKGHHLALKRLARDEFHS